MKIIECQDCQLHKYAKTVCMHGAGDPDPDVIFVGEAPGRNEDDIGEPFVGESGQFLRKYIKKYKIEKSFFTNVVRCRPPMNRTPTQKEMNVCSQFLYPEILSLAPKLVVVLGNCALEVLLGKTGVTLYRGKFFPSEELKCTVFVSYHPAAIRNDPTREHKFDSDFKLIRKFLSGEIEEQQTADYKNFGEIKILRNIGELNSLYKIILKHRMIFWDLETTGTEVYSPELEITSAAFCPKSRVGYVIPYELIGKEETIEFFRKVLTNKNIKKCGQNMNFDCKVIKLKYGISTENWWFDTMLAHFLIEPKRGTQNLHYMVNYYLKDASGYDQFVRNCGGAHKLNPGPALYNYNAMDAMTGFELMNIFEPILKKENTWRIFREILMPVSKHLMDMEIHGMIFDVNYIKTLQKKYQEKLNSIVAAMEEDAGIKEFEWKFGKQFNPKSSKDLSYLLFNYYKLPVLEISSKTKKPSLRSEILERYAEYGNKYCKNLIEYRKLFKLKSTYLNGILEKLYDNVCHSNFNLAVARSGRTSSGRNPDLKMVSDRAFNLQNIPRTKEMRRMLIARPGHALVTGDLSQIELRVLAALSKDEILINMVSGDAHRGMAAVIFNIPPEQVTKEQRRIGKTCNFAIIYGISPKSLAVRLTAVTGKTWRESDAEDLINVISTRFKYLSKWKRFIEWHLKKYKKVVTPLGRIRRFNWTDKKTLREAINTPIQATASDFMLIGIINFCSLLEKENLSAKLVNEIHDQLVAECEIDDDNVAPCPNVIRTGKLMKKAMLDLKWPLSKEKFDWLDVKIDVDVEWGFDMGNLLPLEI